MKTKIVLTSLAVSATVLAGGAFWACGNGDDNSSPVPQPEAGVDATVEASVAPDTGVVSPPVEAGADAGHPPPPVLGAQIDRLGRPAINTALIHGFDPDSGAAGAAKDSYNFDTDAGNWVPRWTPEMAKNLAILDSLDTTDAGSGCGNQPFAQNDAGAARYDTLAGVLANDRLWVNTASTTCTQYLAVELNATGFMANTDCGGRKLTYDVIQTTYSVASGVGLSGFGSGVSAVAAKTSGATFPYLAPPL